jgi:coatomer subunit beta
MAAWLLLGQWASPPYAVGELRGVLEHGTDEEKREAMKQIINMMANGEPLPQLLMTVIRFVLPTRDAVLRSCSCCTWRLSTRQGQTANYSAR